MILGSHGLINWADDDKACYELTLDLIERAAALYRGARPGRRRPSAARSTRRWTKRAATRSSPRSCPGCAGQVSQHKRFVGTVQEDAAILRFVNSHDAPRLAELGTSCPDHFLRTKIKPLYVDWDPQSERRGRAQAAS